MRTAALVIGTFGGFAGVYFAQLLVTGTAFFGILAAAFGGRNAQEPLYYGLAVLAAYTLGIIGGVLAIQRARTAAALMALAATFGLSLTIGAGLSAVSVVSPQASPAPTPAVPALFRTATPAVRSTPAPSAASSAPAASLEGYIVLSIPFIGPAFLLTGALLAALGSHSGQAIGAHAQPARIPPRWDSLSRETKS